MKIAIASTTKDINGEVSVGGRAPYFLIVDEAGNLLESLKNPFAVGGGGAGVSVAKMLADMSVEKIVASHFGEKMTEALDLRNLNQEEFVGQIKDYLAK